MDVRVGLWSKAECRRIDAFELWCWRRLLRVPWTARRSNQYILNIQSWVCFGRTDVKAETPILCPPDMKSQLIGKDPDAGRNWGQEENGMTEDKMAGWHHRRNGCESEWTPGVGDGQGGLACCDSWGRKESDTTEWLNWTELNWTEVCHSSSSKGQASFNFMAAVTICSDFGIQENKVSHCFHCFSIYFLKWWVWMPWSSFFQCWILSHPVTLLFHLH